jgi:hypothetical protein
MTRDPPTDRPSEADESPLRRWSRRKHAAREQPAADQHAAEPDAEQRTDTAATSEAAEQPAASGTDEVTDADVPPVESLTPDSDFSDFMSPKVSESLRRTALRKLFGLPQFNVRDGLDDYDDDYTQFSSLGDTVTADMRYHTERRAAAARERQEAADEAAQAQAPEPTAAGDEEQAAATPTPPADDQSEAEDDPDGIA